jgi:hypothetical protein
MFRASLAHPQEALHEHSFGGCNVLLCGPGSSDGLDGPGIESRCGRNFSHTSRPVLGPNVTIDTGSFPGVKRPGRGDDHPPPSSAEVENE